MIAWIPFRAADFDAAMLVFHALWDSAGAAAALPEHAWLLLPALLAATLGPTSQRLAHELLRPRRSIALACGVLLTALLLATGGWRAPEFIYFQF